MMKRLGMAALASAMGLMIAAPALHADEESGPGGGAHVDRMLDRMFQQLDANGDGQITPAERDAAKAARFNAVDTDGSGGVSYDEYSAMIDRRQAEMRQRRFSHMDGDSDGVLSPDEMQARRGMHRGYRGRHGRHGGGGGDMMGRLDANGDGIVTREEAKAQMEARMAEHKKHWQERQDGGDNN